MFGRGFLFVLVLAAAFFVPYFLAGNQPSDEGFLSRVWGRVTNGDAPDESYSALRSLAELPSAADTSLPPFAQFPELHLDDTSRRGGPALQSPLELFRFDVTPTWVLDNWSRVTTRLWHDDLEGMRVAVVSGTSSHDIVGSLTYYFDRQKKLQRIRFHGHTGDPSHLVAGLAQAYNLRDEPTLGGGLYVTRWNDQPTSVVRMEHSSVVKATNALTRMKIDLELNRPGRIPALSDEFLGILGQGKSDEG